MKDTKKPSQHDSKDKAEGDRWSSEQNTVQRVGKEAPAENPGDDTDNAGGITNRPLDQEIGSQDALPPRGINRRER